MTNKVTIYIDGSSYQVPNDINLLQACLSLNFDVPYFCWHPAMGSVGACRQCAVMQYQNAEDTRGRLVMSCMTPVTEGMRISFNNEKAHTFRETNIEAIMTNHPHDCPVCEEGGDCHLQDMTLISGHIKRRYPGTKRTHNNQYLGPFLNHEMNRCIGCYRCVRFYRDYCGGKDLNVFSSKNNIYFGRAKSGTLENEFSGNLVEVCPTGVFTDKPFSKQFIRKWDLQSAPSICTNCSVGCNTYVTERDGIIRKINNRFNDDINGHFLCDRGRFGYQHLNHENRLSQVWLRDQQEQQTHILDNEQAHVQLTQWLHEPNAKIVGVGSPRSSLENNAALHHLVGKGNFYAGLPENELSQLKLLTKTYQSQQVNVLSLKEIEQTDAVLLVGEDVTQTAPRVALSIRQMTKNAGIIKAAKLGIKPWQDEAVRNITQDTKSALIIINSHTTKLADIAKHNVNFSPNEQLTLLLEIEQYLIDNKTASSELAITIALDLINANNPAIITGTHSFDINLLSACLRISALLKKQKDDTGFYCATSAVNSLGLSLLSEPEQDINNVIQNIKSDPPTLLIIMETDLYRFLSDKKLDACLDNIKHIVVIEHLITDTVQMADLVLPATSFAEQNATWINNEGTAQQAYAVMPKSAQRQSPYSWLAQHHGLDNEHKLYKYIQSHSEVLLGISPFYISVQNEFLIARQPLRSSARTAFFANIDVKEYAPKRDEKSNLNYSMEGVSAFRQQSLDNTKHKITTPVTGVWSPKWNSGQAINKTSLQDNHNLETSLFSTVSAMPFDLPPAQKEPNNQSLTNLSICPQHHIYANDELASFSPSIQELAPVPLIYLNQKQADDLGLKADEFLTITSDDYQFSLAFKINNDIADKVLLVPFNEFIRLGKNAKVSTENMVGGSNE
jgi:NADH-quinone oxidoreductase subunit G